MDIKHAITFNQLYDYFAELADEQTASLVEAHLASCIACRELLRVMAVLSGAPAEEISSTGGDHPLLEDLVHYYKDADSLEPGLLSRIESHLKECPDCRSELAFLRELEKDMHRALDSRNNPPA